MRALHLPFRPSTNSTPPFAFPVKPANPGDLLFSDTYSMPEFQAQLHRDTGDSEESSGNTYRAHKPDDNILTAESANGATLISAPHDPCNRRQYLLQVIATSPTRGELTWKETLLPERFTIHRAPIPCHDVVGLVIAIKGHSKLLPAGELGGFRHASESGPKYAIGDVVYGLLDFDRDGAAADQVVVFENEICKVPVPPQGISQDSRWENMLATIPLAGLTAWQALFEHGGLQEPGFELQSPIARDTDRSNFKESGLTKVLITGGSGAVGLLAIQMAAAARSRSQEIHITAVCSSQHAKDVQRLGADVIAYHDHGSQSIENEIKRLAPFDLFLDLTGPPLLSDILSMVNSYSEEKVSAHVERAHKEDSSPALLRSAGKIISIATPWTDDVAHAIKTDEPGRSWLKDRYKFFIVKPDAEQLRKISDLVEHGRLKSFVHEEVFGLERGREAIEECEKRGRRTIGKVVIHVSGPSFETIPVG